MTANEKYREYKKEGGTLSFAGYMTREKAKKFVNFDGSPSEIPINKPLSDSIAQTLDQIHKDGGLKTTLDNKFIFGINRNYLIAAGVVAIGVTAFVIYKHVNKNK